MVAVVVVQQLKVVELAVLVVAVQATVVVVQLTQVVAVVVDGAQTLGVVQAVLE